MRRVLLAAACIVLLPALAVAQSYTASLTGSEGTGFGTLTISGDNTIDYTILVSGITPTSAALTDGSNEIDLGASFTNGSAFGSATSSLASNVASSPASWTLEINDGALSGALAAGGAGGGTEVYFPVSASNPGVGDDLFRTDARIVNRSSAAAEATLEFFPGANDSGNSQTTVTIDLDPNEQLVLEDFLVNTFGFSSGQGAVKITSDASLLVASRVYNDQTGADMGTLGLFVDAVDMTAARTAGTILFLQNRRFSDQDFRGAVGWFNPNDSEISVTVYGWDTAGTLLGSASVTAAAFEQAQLFINDIWPALEDYGDMYVTYVASDGVFFYGTLVDNESGDGTYIPAK